MKKDGTAAHIITQLAQCCLIRTKAKICALVTVTRPPNNCNLKQLNQVSRSSNELVCYYILCATAVFARKT